MFFSHPLKIISLFYFFLKIVEPKAVNGTGSSATLPTASVRYISSPLWLAEINVSPTLIDCSVIGDS